MSQAKTKTPKLKAIKSMAREAIDRARRDGRKDDLFTLVVLSAYIDISKRLLAEAATHRAKS